ncbi:MAG: ABC transporter ATP-binding protein [Opitutales bacterium]
MSDLTFQNVGKTYPGEVRAVKEFSLHVENGEFLVLVGPSGCGKTTVLRMLAGLETITSGEISIDDRIVNEVAPGDRDVSMVFQNYALFPHLDVFQNMAFGLRARRYPKDEIVRRVQDVANRLGLSDLLRRKPAALSGGQRQRVALGRAIARKPKVYLMDEPLSNLDAQLRLSMRKELTDLRKELGVTTLYVTHDQSEALTLGDRICVMKDGEIQQVNTPKEAYDRPANRFVAGFLGNVPMNFIEGRFQEKDSDLFFSFDDQSIQIPRDLFPKSVAALGNSAVSMGIRPEHLKLQRESKAKDVVTLKVHLDRQEWHGDYSLLHLKGSFGTLLAKIGTGEAKDLSEGIPLTMEATFDHCHFFGETDHRNLLFTSQ